MTAKSKIAVSADGAVSGSAWIQPSKPGLELHVVGKITMRLLPDGQTASVANPERPGHHRGLPSPEELDPSAVRMVIIRGARAVPGRVVLRRGPTVLAESAFDAGSTPMVIELSSTMQTTVAGRRGDEWLVVETAGGPEARRWCKVPKIGILATWNDIERLVLTSRVCLVDVTDWSLSFVLRASRRLPAAMAPDTVRVSTVDLSGGGMGATPSPMPSPLARAVAAPPAPPIDLADDDDLARTAIRAPAKSPLLARPIDDPTTVPRASAPVDESSSSEPRTRLVDVASHLPPEAVPPAIATRRANTRKPSSAGLRIGWVGGSPPAHPTAGRTTTGSAAPPDLGATVKREPIPARIHEEETAASAGAEAAPTSVTRAFAAMSPDAVPLKYELLRRVKEGLPLVGLSLVGADLSGVALPGAALSSLDFSRADLSQSDLTGADLTAAKLDGTRLDHAKLDGADFMCSTLVGASLRATSVVGANFAGADLSGADISGATPLSGFAGATLAGARRD